jgi:hypothetical protein
MRSTLIVSKGTNCSKTMQQATQIMHVKKICFRDKVFLLQNFIVKTDNKRYIVVEIIVASIDILMAYLTQNVIFMNINIDNKMLRVLSNLVM